jgi:hypothetical protein
MTLPFSFADLVLLLLVVFVPALEREDDVNDQHQYG